MTVKSDWFSASDLAELGKSGVADLPTTAQGCRLRAEGAGWESREVPGRGGPGGKRTEYRPDPETLRRIEEHNQSLTSPEEPDRRHGDRRKDSAQEPKPRDQGKGTDMGLMARALEAVVIVLQPDETGMTLEDERDLLHALYARFVVVKRDATVEEIADYLRYCIENRPRAAG